MVGPPEGPTKIDKDKDVHAFEENTLKSRDKRDKNLPVLEIVNHNFFIYRFDLVDNDNMTKRQSLKVEIHRSTVSTVGWLTYKFHQ